MPNRLIRSGFVDSDAIDALDYDEECFYHRLLLTCDDAGRFDGRPAVLASHLFPLGVKLGTDPVGKGLMECTEQGLILRYDFAGKPFIQVTNWMKCSSAKISKWPCRAGTYDITFVQMPTRHGLKEFVASSVRPQDYHRIVGDPPPVPPVDDGRNTVDGDGDGKTEPLAHPVATPSAPPSGRDEAAKRHPHLAQLWECPMLRSITLEQYLRCKQARSKDMDWDAAIAEVLRRAWLETDIKAPARFLDVQLSYYEKDHVSPKAAQAGTMAERIAAKEREEQAHVK